MFLPRDIRTGKLMGDNDEMVAIDMWRGMLKIKGLPLDTPYMMADKFARNQPRFESILDYLWRRILVKKGFKMLPAKRMFIHTVIETGSLFQPRWHIRVRYEEENDVKEKMAKVIESPPPPTTTSIKQNRHIHFRYESDDEEEFEEEDVSENKKMKK
ncbi:hypothetical protein Tco_0025533 [Tanacetum coccineum]